ncbi:hypothetical protein D3C81_1816230 [compost metagenome]
MDAFLVKPATLDQLRATLEAYLQGRSTGAMPTLNKDAPVLDDAAASQNIVSSPEDFEPARIDDAALHGLLTGMLADDLIRSRFRQALQADRAALLAHLDTPSGAALAGWCHHAGGGLSALGQPYLRELVDRFHALAQSESPDLVRTMGQTLVGMYNYLLDVLKDDASV